jgi:hypothetical protein
VVAGGLELRTGKELEAVVRRIGGRRGKGRRRRRKGKGTFGNGKRMERWSER